jgi:hypothetical protein
MPTEAVTRLYAGLDLHKSNVFCGIKDQEGKPIYRRRLPAELPVILEALVPYRGQLEAVAVESTFNWYWLVDGLQAAGLPVRLMLHWWPHVMDNELLRPFDQFRDDILYAGRLVEGGAVELAVADGGSTSKM